MNSYEPLVRSLRKLHKENLSNLTHTRYIAVFIIPTQACWARSIDAGWLSAS